MKICITFSYFCLATINISWQEILYNLEALKINMIECSIADIC